MADGFKIADGYVEVHGVVDRRSVILAADRVTRGVSDQMTTGVAFSNLREGGRKMGAVLGEHGGPNAARELTEGIASHIDGGGSAGNIDTAGQSLGRLLGRSGGSPFVEHIIAEVNRRANAMPSIGAPGGGGDGTTGDPRDRGGGRDRGMPSPGVPGRGGDSGGGRRGPAGPSGKDAEREGSRLGQQLALGALGSFMRTFSDGFSGPFRAILANPIIGTAAIALGAGLAALAAPAFAAAFAAALIGGAGLGVIGLGAFLLRDDPEVKKAAGKLKDTAGRVFKGGAQVLVEPFVNSMAILENLLVKIGPDITEMFFAIAPAIVPLTRGFAGFVEAALPGFIELIKAATPFLMDLEHTLPRFGEHIGKFMAIIAEAGPAATVFFRDFLHLLGILLVAFGIFVTTLANVYEQTRSIILLLVDVFMFLGRQIEGSFKAIKRVIGEWYDFWRDIFVSARRDSDGFVGFLKALPGKVWEAIKGIPGRVKSVFADAGSWLKRAGSDIIAGLIRGIKDAIPGLSGVLDWVTGMIPDWKGPAERDRKLLEPTGQMIMQGLGRGIVRGADDVRGQLGQVTASLPAAAAPMITTNAGGITINIHTSISRWSEVPGEVIAQLDAALSRYRKAYA